MREIKTKIVTFKTLIRRGFIFMSNIEVVVRYTFKQYAETKLLGK